MARDIDVDNLDVDQVQYLDERPWLIAEAKQLGVEDIEERMDDVRKKAAKAEERTLKSGSYDKLNLRELRQVARDRHLDASGDKKELAQRLKEEDEREKALESLSDDPGVVQPVEPTPDAEGTASINENPGDSVLGDSHPAPNQ